MRKLALDLSLAQLLPEKINKMFSLNKLGFIDVLSTVLQKLTVPRIVDQFGHKKFQKKHKDLDFNFF